MNENKLSILMLVLLLIFSAISSPAATFANTEGTDDEIVEEIDSVQDAVEGEADETTYNVAEESTGEQTEGTVDDTAPNNSEDAEDSQEISEEESEEEVSAEEQSEESVEAPSTEERIKEDESSDEETPVEEEAEENMVTVMATGGPGVYEPDDGSIALNTTLDGQSTNNHTHPVRIWSAGGYVYLAVKSTHAIQQVDLNGVRATPLHVYEPLQQITIDGTTLDPAQGLQGNTKDAHFTVVRYPLSSLNINADGTYSFSVKGIGAGHDVGGNFYVEVPKVSAELTKVWVDGPMNGINVDLNHQFGTYDTVYIEPADGTDTGTYNWSDLPYSDNTGIIYVYTIVESDPGEGYTVAFDSSYDAQNMHYIFNLINTYTVQTEDITVTKVWDGGPAEKPDIDVELLRNGEAVETITLSGGETSHTWTDLPMTSNGGDPYDYSVREVSVPDNYESNTDGFTITNTFISPLKDFTVEKVWIDGPENKPAIKLQLHQNGTPMADVETPTLNDGETDYTWTDLPEFDQNGVPYDYTVVEIEGADNYEIGYSSEGAADFTVTNTFTIAETAVTVNKLWEGGKPSPVEVQLTRDGEDHGDPITLSDEHGWSHTWSDLPETDKSGTPYSYEVVELTSLENFTASMDAGEDGTFNITNTYKSPQMDYTASKEWVGGGRKYDIDLQLMQNGEPLGDPVSLESGSTSYTWEGLDQTDNDGIPYEYTVVEVDGPEDFESSYTHSESGTVITNTYVVPKKDIPVEKVWVGGPEEKEAITIDLYRTSEEDEDILIDSVELEDGTTTYTFTDLDETDFEGTPYTYYISERDVPENYRSTVDGFTVINEFTEVDIHLFKVDVGDSPLSEVEFTLFNEEGDEVVGSFITDENGYALIDGINVGTYRLQETTPEGFITNDDMKSLEVLDDGTVLFDGDAVSAQTIYVKNYPLADLHIEKVELNDHSTKIEGVEYALYKVIDGSVGEEVMATQVTDAFGRVSFGNLDKGSYAFREIDAPFEYVIDETYNFVEVDDQGRVMVNSQENNDEMPFVHENERFDGAVVIDKYDREDPGIKLSGAVFDLYRVEDGEEVHIANGVTDEEGYLRFDGVFEGSYVLKETKAPTYMEDGVEKSYRMPSSPKEYEWTREDFAENDMVITLEVANSKSIWHLPDTGGIGTTAFTVVGLILMALSIAWRVRFRKSN